MHKLDFKRAVVDILIQRLFEPRRFIQVITGPRQVGKTTAVHQMLAEWSGLSHYATADAPAPPQSIWIEQQWQIASLPAPTRCGLVKMVSPLKSFWRNRQRIGFSS